jgi:hypothetical protein
MSIVWWWQSHGRFSIVIASVGHTSAHTPQLTHRAGRTSHGIAPFIA